MFGYSCIRTMWARNFRAADDVVQLPWSRQTSGIGKMSRNPVAHLQQLPFQDVPLPSMCNHTCPPQGHKSYNTLAPSHLYDMSKESADGSYRGPTTPRPDSFVAQKHLDANVSNDLLSCESASESSPRCLKAMSARKPQKRFSRVATKGLEHPTSPKSTHRRVIVPSNVIRTP